MADANIQQKVLTEPTFINGSLLPAGSIVSVNMDEFVDEDGNPAPDKSLKNLADVGEAPVLVPVEVAAIGPTGPRPTAPQQKPPGTLETAAGFTNGGSILIAEGHPDAQEMIAGAEAQNEGVEEEAIERLSSSTNDAGTAGTNGTETGALDEGQPFNGETYVAGTIADADFSGLTAEQLQAVHDAEAKGQNRTGMLDKIDDAIRALNG